MSMTDHQGRRRPWGVVLREASLMDLMLQFHGCMMLCANSNVNMRE